MNIWKRKMKGMALGEAPAAVLLLVLIGITAVVGQKIAAQLQVGEATTTNVYLAAANVSTGISQVTQQLTLVGLIVIMAIVIGVLFRAFGGMFRGGGI